MRCEDESDEGKHIDNGGETSESVAIGRGAFSSEVAVSGKNYRYEDEHNRSKARW
jgi:hypothetical protein